MFITYINTELKTNLKNGSINEDGNNLRELLMPTHCDESDEDNFIPENELLIDLNASIFYYEKVASKIILYKYLNIKFLFKLYITLLL